MFKKFGNAKKPKWEVYGDTVRDMMAKNSGLGVND
jgi:hypothetical protein